MSVQTPSAAGADLHYLSGFGSAFETEAVAGALPVGRNSPQKPAFGLYAEQLSGSAFTAPRLENRRSWLYRLRPSAQHPAFQPYAGAPLWRSGPFDEVPPSPNRMRWSPLDWPSQPTDFIDGMTAYAGSGDPAAQSGIVALVYVANTDMTGRAFFNADGEMLILPQEGRLDVWTEFGRLKVAPGELLLMPRGVRFRVALPDGKARGYVCENYGAHFRLPERGPIGSNSMASERDFLAPVAAYEDIDAPTEVIQKYLGGFWTTTFDHSPFDVVAWHGTLTPFKYDIARYATVGSISIDHPDPSIFTVLTSPTDSPGTANCDFAIFPPRWMVAEDTFRPPWFHRNVMSEFMGLIHGEYDAKEGGGFDPGGASLHNCMSGHGPDQTTYERATTVELKPHKIDKTLAFMFESRFIFRPTRWAVETPAMQLDYDDVWTGFTKGSPK
ncbi:MAG TPA: homogentisate 1,2-dioxygenase [Brevundimonas sp.]|uniref:homogentisate 1,2-dioxygenase n=1 Tax=Brevundimonas sp. TaxID=1871086 RepID=UPI002B6D6F9E|nr:homogentisate 1,2-dioxygenase [Brevundimonas sp.]HRH20354.1 homogentisate 1,2-dioxygenase [Brevundimonas sp.]